MPRYYFDVHDGTNFPDNEGKELPDLSTARQEALLYAGHLIRDLGASFWDEPDWRIEVKNEEGVVQFALIFVSVGTAAQGRPALSSQAVA